MNKAQEKIQHLWCQHCKALQKTNDMAVECWYNPLDADGAFAFCAANEDAVKQILTINEDAVKQILVIKNAEIEKRDKRIKELQNTCALWERLTKDIKAKYS